MKQDALAKARSWALIETTAPAREPPRIQAAPAQPPTRPQLHQLVDHALASQRFPYVYFHTPKCACTTLKTLFWKAELARGGTRRALKSYDVVHLEQHKLGGPWRRGEADILDTLCNEPARLWFMYVRNPYVRALSAYEWLLGKDANSETRLEYGAKIGWTRDEIPSFATFIDLLTAHGAAGLDHHFAPITSFMPLNDMRLDYIASVEYFAEDTREIMRRAFGDASAFDPDLRMYTSSRSPLGEVLESLPTRSLAALQSFYARDFETFGYSRNPNLLTPDRETLWSLAGPHALGEAPWLHGAALAGGPRAPRQDFDALLDRVPEAAPEGLPDLVLRNADAPDWWAARGNQLWTPPGAPLPNIAPHPGDIFPEHSCVVSAGGAPPARTLLWGSGNLLVLGEASQLAGLQVSCGDGATVYLGKGLIVAGEASLDARNGARVVVEQGGLWFPGVRLATDGLHAIRDRSTRRRLNPFGASISIGPQVWLGRNVTVFGDTRIGEAAAVQDHSLVQGAIASRSWFGGNPAVLLHEDIEWTLENAP